MDRPHNNACPHVLLILAFPPTHTLPLARAFFFFRVTHARSFASALILRCVPVLDRDAVSTGPLPPVPARTFDARGLPPVQLLLLQNLNFHHGTVVHVCPRCEKRPDTGEQDCRDRNVGGVVPLHAGNSSCPNCRQHQPQGKDGCHRVRVQVAQNQQRAHGHACGGQPRHQHVGRMLLECRERIVVFEALRSQQHREHQRRGHKLDEEGGEGDGQLGGNPPAHDDEQGDGEADSGREEDGVHAQPGRLPGEEDAGTRQREKHAHELEREEGGFGLPDLAPVDVACNGKVPHKDDGTEALEDDGRAVPVCVALAVVNERQHCRHAQGSVAHGCEKDAEPAVVDTEVAVVRVPDPRQRTEERHKRRRKRDAGLRAQHGGDGDAVFVRPQHDRKRDDEEGERECQHGPHPLGEDKAQLEQDCVDLLVVPHRRDQVAVALLLVVREVHVPLRLCHRRRQERVGLLVHLGEAEDARHAAHKAAEERRPLRRGVVPRRLVSRRAAVGPCAVPAGRRPVQLDGRAAAGVRAAAALLAVGHCEVGTGAGRAVDEVGGVGLAVDDAGGAVLVHLHLDVCGRRGDLEVLERVARRRRVERAVGLHVVVHLLPERHDAVPRHGPLLRHPLAQRHRHVRPRPLLLRSRHALHQVRLRLHGCVLHRQQAHALLQPGRRRRRPGLHPLCHSHAARHLPQDAQLGVAPRHRHRQHDGRRGDVPHTHRGARCRRQRRHGVYVGGYPRPEGARLVRLAARRVARHRR
eukprot:Rhum_TRINITY_DN14588_c26_g1::Rhum_TRINITY_DN14588_c26_g1_i1::g.96119::m.96119